MTDYMAWKRESDTSAHNPVVLAPLLYPAWPDNMTGLDCVNLVWGFVSRAATMAAGLGTYTVDAGTLAGLGGDNWMHWVLIAERAGYLTPIQPDGGGDITTWQLIEDSDGLFHIRRKEEIAWERQRKRDNSDRGLIIPARLRDGDACRYCGCIVDWRSRNGGRSGTYDHRVPGVAARTVDDLRVACQSCNASRNNHENADEIRPVLPPPDAPFYGQATVDLLASAGHTVTLSHPATPAKPGPRTRAPRDPAPRRIPHPHHPRPRRRWNPAPTPPRPRPRRNPARRDPAPRRTPPPSSTRRDLPARQKRALRKPEHRVGPGRVGPGPGRSAALCPQPPLLPMPPPHPEDPGAVEAKPAPTASPLPNLGAPHEADHRSPSPARPAP